MPFFIDVFHGFYRTAIVPTFIDIVPFLINIVPTNNLFLSAICFLQEFCLSFNNVNSFTTPYCYGVTCVPNVGNDKNSWSWKKFPIGIWKKLMNYFVLSKQFTSSPLYNFQEIALKLDPLQGY